MAELGEPCGRLWRLLSQTHGPRKAARLLASVLAALVRQGEEVVSKALEVALEAGHCDLARLHERLHPRRLQVVAVPEKLRLYQVEAARATDYDWMLEAGGER